MAEEVYYPEQIADQGIASIGSQTVPASTSGSTKSGQSVNTPQSQPTKALPHKVIAHETISSSFDTLTKRIKGVFEFTKLGAIKIGEYVFGVSGEINITPNGITGKNVNGDTTFSIDGTTGDATFKGTVQAGSLISGDLTLGGSGDGDGTMSIADASGNEIIRGDNLGHHYYTIVGQELVRVDSSGLTGFDTGGNEILHLKTTALELYGTNGDILKLLDSAAGTVWGRLGYSTSAAFVHTISLDSRGAIELSNYESDTDFSILQARLILGYKSPLYESVLLDSINGDVDISAGGDVNLSCNNFTVNGSVKTAIVPTREGYKALYCTEAPEVWFFDFANVKRHKLFFWKKTYDIDPLFLETVEGIEHITPTLNRSVVQVWGKRKGYKGTRLEERSYQDFIKNNAFWNTPTITS